MQSVVVAVTRVNDAIPTIHLAPVTMNLNSTTKGCTPSSSGALNCTASIAAPVGNDTFSVEVFSERNGLGQQLSVTQAVTTISGGSKTMCLPKPPQSSSPVVKSTTV